MRIKHFYYFVLYLLHIRALGKLTSMEASQQSKINEVNEHLLNKDKIDTQLTSESHHDDSAQVHYVGPKAIFPSFDDNKTYIIMFLIILFK